MNPLHLYNRSSAGPLGQQERSVLQQQLAKFPYFSLLHLIQARELKLGAESVAEGDPIAKAALYAHDRARLAEFVERPIAPPSENPEPTGGREPLPIGGRKSGFLEDAPSEPTSPNAGGVNPRFVMPAQRKSSFVPSYLQDDENYYPDPVLPATPVASRVDPELAAKPTAEPRAPESATPTPEPVTPAAEEKPVATPEPATEAAAAQPVVSQEDPLFAPEEPEAPAIAPFVAETPKAEPPVAANAPQPTPTVSASADAFNVKLQTLLQVRVGMYVPMSAQLAKEIRKHLEEWATASVVAQVSGKTAPIVTAPAPVIAETPAAEKPEPTATAVPPVTEPVAAAAEETVVEQVPPVAAETPESPSEAKRTLPPPPPEPELTPEQKAEEERLAAEALEQHNRQMGADPSMDDLRRKLLSLINQQLSSPEPEPVAAVAPVEPAAIAIPEPEPAVTVAQEDTDPSLLALKKRLEQVEAPTPTTEEAPARKLEPFFAPPAEQHVSIQPEAKSEPTPAPADSDLKGSSESMRRFVQPSFDIKPETLYVEGRNRRSGELTDEQPAAASEPVATTPEPVASVEPAQPVAKPETHQFPELEALKPSTEHLKPTPRAEQLGGESSFRRFVEPDFSGGASVRLRNRPTNFDAPATRREPEVPQPEAAPVPTVEPPVVAKTPATPVQEAPATPETAQPATTTPVAESSSSVAPKPLEEVGPIQPISTDSFRRFVPLETDTRIVMRMGEAAEPAVEPAQATPTGTPVGRITEEGADRFVEVEKATAHLSPEAVDPAPKDPTMTTDSFRRFVEPEFGRLRLAPTLHRNFDETEPATVAETAPAEPAQTLPSEPIALRENDLGVEIVIKPEQMRYFREIPVQKPEAPAEAPSVEAPLAETPVTEAPVQVVAEEKPVAEPSEIMLKDRELRRLMGPETFQHLEKAFEAPPAAANRASEILATPLPSLPAEPVMGEVIEASESALPATGEAGRQTEDFAVRISAFRENLSKIRSKGMPLPEEINLRSIQQKFLDRVVRDMTGEQGREPNAAGTATLADPRIGYDVERDAPDSPLPVVATNVDDLITRFAEFEPRLGSLKAEGSAETLSEAEIEAAEAAEMEAASETLAEILVKQGNLEKARQVYQKLQLKFPEKSTYFADLINRLQ